MLNLTPRRVQQLAKQGVIPRANRGVYPLAACVRGYIQFLQRAIESGGAAQRRDEQAGLAQARARKADADAALAELDLAQKRGELVRRDDVLRAWDNVLDRLRARIVAFPPKAAPHVVGCDNVRQAVRVLEGVAEELIADLRSGNGMRDAA